MKYQVVYETDTHFVILENGFYKILQIGVTSSRVRDTISLSFGEQYAIERCIRRNNAQVSTGKDYPF